MVDWSWVAAQQKTLRRFSLLWRVHADMPALARVLTALTSLVCAAGRPAGESFPRAHILP